MTWRIKNVMGAGALVLALASIARPAVAEPSDSTGGLQSPEQRSVRASAYALPKGMWAFEAGALGVSGEELYGSLGVSRGFGAGFHLELNAAHYSVGLFNLSARWSFLETRHLALAANVNFTYGHGAWMWILRPGLRDLVEDVDLISVPIIVSASVPLFGWLQLDLAASYRYGHVYGTLGDSPSFSAAAELGASQVSFRPGVRVFASDATALELAADIPVYTYVPWEGEISGEFLNRGFERSGSGGATVPPSETWKLEVGVRSRVTSWLFCTLRIHYGRSNKVLYYTTINPSLSLEFRL